MHKNSVGAIFGFEPARGQAGAIINCGSSSGSGLFANSGILALAPTKKSKSEGAKATKVVDIIMQGRNKIFFFNPFFFYYISGPL